MRCSYSGATSSRNGVSLLIGDRELALGDSINIETTGSSWIKRLDASHLSMDQGYVRWDGIDYRGVAVEPGGESHIILTDGF